MGPVTEASFAEPGRSGEGTGANTDYVQIGSSAGLEASLPADLAARPVNRIRIAGSGVGSRSAGEMLAEAPEVMARFADGFLQPPYTAFPLSRVGEAWAHTGRSRAVVVPDRTIHPSDVIGERKAMQKRALVVGLGIAGMSAAIGLRRAGWTPVIVERAPERRTGGYFIFMFPEGVRAAADLGIADHLHTRNPQWRPGGNSWSVDCRGRRKPALGLLDAPSGLAAVLRSDIEAALWQGINGDGTQDAVEVRFATTPVEITEDACGVRVLLEDAGTGKQYREDFDLVVGADGMRSSVRRMVFGPDENYLANWKAMICAFQLKEQVPTYEASDSIIVSRPKRAMWVFGLADHAPCAWLTYRTEDIPDRFAGPSVEQVRAAFSGMDDDPVVRHVLDSLEQAPDHVFDSIHQVRMDRWSTGRVVLVGDAAWCMNTYSAMGSSSSLRGGAALGAALQEHPDDLAAALDAWETGLRPYITRQRRSARIKQQRFVPSSRPVQVLVSCALELIRRIVHRRLAAEFTASAAVPSGTAR